MSVRRGLLAAIALLYACSVPWYRDGGAALSLWFGLPDWVAAALACYFAIALLNAVAWLRTDVRDTVSADAWQGGAVAEPADGEGAS